MSYAPKFKSAVSNADYQIQQIVKKNRDAAEFSYLRKDVHFVSIVGHLMREFPVEFNQWLSDLGFTQGIADLELKNQAKIDEERFTIVPNFKRGVMEMKRGILSLGPQPMKDILVLVKPFEEKINIQTEGFSVFLVSVMMNEKALAVLNTTALLRKYY